MSMFDFLEEPSGVYIFDIDEIMTGSLSGNITSSESFLTRVKNQMLNTLRYLQRSGATVYIISGATKTSGNMFAKLLTYNLIDTDYLLLRDEDESKTITKGKVDVYKKEIEGKFNVIAAFGTGEFLNELFYMGVNIFPCVSYMKPEEHSEYDMIANKVFKDDADMAGFFGINPSLFE